MTSPTGPRPGRSPGFVRSYAAVLRRELLSLAVLPQTYVIAAAYVIVSGVFFVSVLGQSKLPDLERFYSNIGATLVVLVPVISMRGLAEERATGTLDVTLSWPLSRAATVLAKFSSHVLFVWALMATSWIYVRILSRYGNIEIGKTVAGFIGLMALAAAFCAVSLAISARSGSVAGGAFVAVLLLVCLWSVQYADTWPLGKTLAGLSPARRLEAAGQGVLYAPDMAYFLGLVALGLGTTLGLVERQGGVPKRQYARRLVVMSAAVIASCVVLGTMGHISGQVDLTPTQRFTLTATSRNIARAVHQPVRVSAFVDPASAEAVQIRNLHRRYRAAGADMSLDIVDPDREPGRMKELGVSGYGQLLVRVGSRKELVDHFGEIALTTAVYRLGREHNPVVCFTIGHGERSIEDAGPDGYRGFASALEGIGYQARSIALVGPGGDDELATCQVVAIAGGTGRFEPDEVERLHEFVNKGGRAVVLAEGGPTDPTSTIDLLEPYGVAIEPHVVHDVASLASDSASVLAHNYPSDSPITKRLSASGLPTLVVGGQELVTRRGTESGDDPSASATALLATTDRAWAAGAPGARGGRVLAVAIDRSVVLGPNLLRSRVGVVSSVEVGANRFIDRFGNQEFLTSLVQWSASEAEIISASRDPGGVRRIELTDADQHDVVRRAVVLPAVAAIIPFPIAVRRRKRG